jgi:hypothetical protein
MWPALERLSPGLWPLVKELDELASLFRRQGCQERQGRGEQLALQAAARLPRFIKQAGRRRLICVRFGEFGPSGTHQRFYGLSHLLHVRAHDLGVSLEGLSLLWIERELRPYPLKPLCRARRQPRTLNADPQGSGDKA